MREIELAKFQQNRLMQRLEADVQMREGEDGEIRMRDLYVRAIQGNNRIVIPMRLLY